MNTFEHILCQFPEIGTVKEVAPLTSGIINQTYLVKTCLLYTSPSPRDCS